MLNGFWAIYPCEMQKELFSASPREFGWRIRKTCCALLAVALPANVRRILLLPRPPPTRELTPCRFFFQMLLFSGRRRRHTRNRLFQVERYLGIPYAVPPVGGNRFKDPELRTAPYPGGKHMAQARARHFLLFSCRDLAARL